MKPFLHRLCTDVPLIAEGALLAMLHDRIEPQAAEHPFYKQLREKLRPQMTVGEDGTAIIPVEGSLARKPDVIELFYGVEDTSNILDMVESAGRNPEVRGALLDMDSPGGFMTGGPEVADAVRRLNKAKPVVAWTGGTMASLAYWIGSQAGAVVASRSAIVGSIGAFGAHFDYTKFLESLGVKVEIFKNSEGTFKAAGAFGTALTDEQRSHIQGRIQASFGEFRRAVTSARPGIQDEAMRGQTFSGGDAKKLGLVDRIGDRNYALSVLRSAIRSNSK